MNAAVSENKYFVRLQLSVLVTHVPAFKYQFKIASSME